MSPVRIGVADLASVLPPSGLTLVSSCSAESDVLARAVTTAGDALGAMTFSGVFVPGLNRATWCAGSASRVLTFFQTPELRAGGERVEFLPLCYRDILAELRRRRPVAALFMCSPPDAMGQCSFGTETSFIAELWREIPVRIAHINPAMPRTGGDPGIPLDAMTAWLEEEQPLRGIEAGEPDAVACAIAGHIAPFVRDGDTVQTGLGKVPDAVLDALSDRRRLRIHSGLIGDGVLRLLDAGALDGVVAGCAIGSAALYAGLGDQRISFQPVSVTHGAAALAQIERLVTINSALEVDLFGQVHAELTPRGFLSGPGGASDYARAAGEGGLRVIALPASARAVSRIIPGGQGAGPVSLSRMDVDIVVTEHGAADLRGLGHDCRAASLIAIAAPDFREALARSWRDATATF